jgi:hypothetical protein
MEVERLVPVVVKTPSYSRLVSSIHATLPHVLSQPLTFRLFSQDEPLIIDLYLSLLTSASSRTSRSSSNSRSETTRPS